MKTSRIALFTVLVFVLGANICYGQNDSQRVFNAINAKREQMKLPPLAYRIGQQVAVDERALSISYNFEVAETCDCDYESLAGSPSMQGLIEKMTNTRKYDWMHFEPNARFVTISVVESEGIYYCVARAYIR